MSRFEFATIDTSAYAECSLRLGQILWTLIQPSSSTQGNRVLDAFVESYLDVVCSFDN
jgi:hypothetical protein